MGTKAALITGSARRVGRAIAMQLAGEGWDIAAHYNTSRDEALSLQAEVQAAGVDCRLYAADLSDPAAADRLAAACIGDFPHASAAGQQRLDLQEGHGCQPEPRPVGASTCASTRCRRSC